MTTEKFLSENRPSLLALHEAAHFVIYKSVCKQNNIEPEIYSINAPSKGLGNVTRKPIINHLELEALINSDIPINFKDHFVKLATDEIKIILAGYAAEFVYFKPETTKKVFLETIKRLDKKRNGSDINRALEFAKMIGLNDLLQILELTIDEVEKNWNKISKKAIEIEHPKQLLK